MEIMVLKVKEVERIQLVDDFGDIAAEITCTKETYMGQNQQMYCLRFAVGGVEVERQYCGRFTNAGEE